MAVGPEKLEESYFRKDISPEVPTNTRPDTTALSEKTADPTYWLTSGRNLTGKAAA